MQPSSVWGVVLLAPVCGPLVYTSARVNGASRECIASLCCNQNSGWLCIGRQPGAPVDKVWKWASLITGPDSWRYYIYLLLLSGTRCLASYVSAYTLATRIGIYLGPNAARASRCARQCCIGRTPCAAGKSVEQVLWPGVEPGASCTARVHMCSFAFRKALSCRTFRAATCEAVLCGQQHSCRGSPWNVCTSLVSGCNRQAS